MSENDISSMLTMLGLSDDAHCTIIDDEMTRYSPATDQVFIYNYIDKHPSFYADNVLLCAISALLNKRGWRPDCLQETTVQDFNNHYKQMHKFTPITLNTVEQYWDALLNRCHLHANEDSVLFSLASNFGDPNVLNAFIRFCYFRYVMAQLEQLAETADGFDAELFDFMLFNLKLAKNTFSYSVFARLYENASQTWDRRTIESFTSFLIPFINVVLQHDGNMDKFQHFFYRRIDSDVERMIIPTVFTNQNVNWSVRHKNKLNSIVMEKIQSLCHTYHDYMDSINDNGHDDSQDIDALDSTGLRKYASRNKPYIYTHEIAEMIATEATYKLTVACGATPFFAKGIKQALLLWHDTQQINIFDICTNPDKFNTDIIKAQKRLIEKWNNSLDYALSSSITPLRSFILSDSITQQNGTWNDNAIATSVLYALVFRGKQSISDAFLDIMRFFGKRHIMQANLYATFYRRRKALLNNSNKDTQWHDTHNEASKITLTDTDIAAVQRPDTDTIEYIKHTEEQVIKDISRLYQDFEPLLDALAADTSLQFNSPQSDAGVLSNWHTRNTLKKKIREEFEHNYFRFITTGEKTRGDIEFSFSHGIFKPAYKLTTTDTADTDVQQLKWTGDNIASLILYLMKDTLSECQDHVCSEAELLSVKMLKDFLQKSLVLVGLNYHEDTSQKSSQVTLLDLLNPLSLKAYKWDDIDVLIERADKECDNDHQRIKGESETEKEKCYQHLLEELQKKRRKQRKNNASPDVRSIDWLIDYVISLGDMRLLKELKQSIQVRIIFTLFNRDEDILDKQVLGNCAHLSKVLPIEQLTHAGCADFIDLPVINTLINMAAIPSKKTFLQKMRKKTTVLFIQMQECVKKLEKLGLTWQDVLTNNVKKRFSENLIKEYEMTTLTNEGMPPFFRDTFFPECHGNEKCQELRIQCMRHMISIQVAHRVISYKLEKQRRQNRLSYLDFIDIESLLNKYSAEELISGIIPVAASVISVYGSANLFQTVLSQKIRQVVQNAKAVQREDEHPINDLIDYIAFLEGTWFFHAFRKYLAYQPLYNLIDSLAFFSPRDYTYQNMIALNEFIRAQTHATKPDFLTIFASFSRPFHDKSQYATIRLERSFTGYHDERNIVSESYQIARILHRTAESAKILQDVKPTNQQQPNQQRDNTAKDHARKTAKALFRQVIPLLSPIKAYIWQYITTATNTLLIPDNHEDVFGYQIFSRDDLLSMPNGSDSNEPVKTSIAIHQAKMRLAEKIANQKNVDETLFKKRFDGMITDVQRILQAMKESMTRAKDAGYLLREDYIMYPLNAIIDELAEKYDENDFGDVVYFALSLLSEMANYNYYSNLQIETGVVLEVFRGNPRRVKQS